MCGIVPHPFAGSEVGDELAHPGLGLLRLGLGVGLWHRSRIAI